MTTGTKPVMGTFWYLAPEIRKGGAATPESDWYSLGVLMYRLLTGMWYEPNTKAFDLLAPFSNSTPASTPTSRSFHYCKGVDFTFCPCPAGTNALGKISIAVTRPYWLGDAPVTWRQWRAVRGENYEGGWNGRGGAPATYLTFAGDIINVKSLMAARMMRARTIIPTMCVLYHSGAMRGFANRLRMQTR